MIRLEIAPVDDAKRKFSVMLNPNSLKQDLAINYTNDKSKNQQVQGSPAPKMEFAAYPAEKLSFELMLDSTGVVGGNTDAVYDQIDDLKDIVYRYIGENREPSVVNLTWGDWSFRGRLTQLSVSYTLFSPAGAALRAKVNLNFEQDIDDEAIKSLARKSSPKITKTVTVKAGDTLPLLCAQIYKDSSYYLEVARYNLLSSIRNIPVGTLLYFPPLD